MYVYDIVVADKEIIIAYINCYQWLFTLSHKDTLNVEVIKLPIQNSLNRVCRHAT